MVQGIFRRPDKGEMADTIDIRDTSTIKRVFLKKRDEQEQKYIKLRQPFCGKCLKTEFERIVQQASAQFNSGEVLQDAAEAEKLDVDKLIKNFDKFAERFAGDKAFTLIGSEPVTADKADSKLARALINAPAASLIIQYKLVYECKRYKNHIHNLFLDKDVYDELYGKKGKSESVSPEERISSK